MTPKPIVVIKIDQTKDFGEKAFHETLYRFKKSFEERLPDYHVFVLPLAIDYEQPQDPIQLQVFYEKDFTPIQYEELKQIIMDSLPKKNESAV